MTDCSECGGINDMCGVFLKNINLCDACASIVTEIIFDDKVLIEKEEIEKYTSMITHVWESLKLYYIVKSETIIGNLYMDLKNYYKKVDKEVPE